jgi:N-methylhydantoinase B
MSATATDREIDPITFGVLRHKLDQIIAEAYYTIGRVSGSTVVYEAGDHQEAIVTPDGDLAAFGAGVLHWCKSIGAAVGHVAERFVDNPGYRDGDQFLFNDPYVACVHANDVQVLAPVFYRDELVAWAGSASHQNDVGGVDVGSICLNAENVYQEGFLTEGIKLVEGGVVRRDVEDLVRNMTRIPDLNVLDIRAKIASNNVIRERLLEMVGRYGLETVRALFRDLQRYSEDRVRARLRRIPNGRFTAVNYVEGIRQAWIKIQVTAIKSDDTLKLDFTGSSDQTGGSENISRVGAISSAMNPFISMICHDIPWNEGLFKPVEFVLPEASIVNPAKPAAVSASTPAGANIVVMTASQNALSKMLLASDELRHEACANIGAAFNMPILSGTNRDGSFFTQLILDVLAGGMGALPDRDGADSAQNHWCVKSMIANVETNELLYPFMFLWRREVPDSGGIGRFRGGLGVQDALIAWDTDELTNMNLGVGHEPRNCLGLAGGYPAAHVAAHVKRGVDVARTMFAHGSMPLTVDELDGQDEKIEAKSITQLAAADVLVADTSSGGGGYGDPLEREPRAVAADVQDRKVSIEMAGGAYGVVVDDAGQVDASATRTLRDRLRDERLTKAAR